MSSNDPTPISPVPQLPADAGSDLRELLGSLRRHRHWIAGSAALFLSLAAGFLAAVPPRYTATAQLMIDPRGLQVIDRAITPTSQTSEVAAALAETQMRLLASDTVLSRVVEREQLARDDEFNGAAATLVGLARTAMHDLLGGTRERDPALEALRTLRKRVKTVRPQASFVIELSLSTRDPDKSARLARAVSEAFIEAQNALRRDASQRASDALSGRLQELQERVGRAENAVERFKAQNNIVGASGRLVSEQQLTELTNQLGAARARTGELRARVEQIEKLRRTGVAPDAIPETIQSPAIASLRAQYAEVKRLEDNLLLNLGERHPELGSIRAQSRSLRQQIADEVARIGSAARSDYERARAAESELAKNLEGLKIQSGSVNHLLVRLRELEREAQASRAVYESFLNRTRELKEQQDIDTSNTAVITPALPPARRDGLPAPLLLLVAGALGLAIGAVTAVAREQYDGRVHTARQFTAFTGLPVLATLPRFRSAALADLLAAGAGPARALHRAYDALRDRDMPARPRVVLVAATENAQARATAALNLALVAAARGERVLLVDGDSSATLSQGLGGRGGPSLADLLEGRATLDDAARAERTNLSILAGGAGPNPSGEAISRQLVAAAGRFDLVLVDGGLIGSDPALRAWAEAASDILLVAHAQATPLERLVEARAILGGQAAKVFGALLTTASRRGDAPPFVPVPKAAEAGPVAVPPPSESARSARVPDAQVLPIGRRAASA